MLIHSIPPIYSANSKILILGSFPSVKSREQEFFYGHPQNRFWRVMSAVLGCSLPSTTDEKREMLLSHNIALWDVISVCDITGSADSTIKNAVPNDISIILENTRVKAIFLNGKTAEKYFNKYLRPTTELPSITLPSTSPANAVFGFDALVREWSVIANGLN